VVVSAGLTVIGTSEVDDSAVSLAVSRNTYVPEAEKVAVVLSRLAFPNVTVPAPLNFDHVVCSVLVGNPSSLAVPERFALAGRVRAEERRVGTAGAVFGGVTLTVTTT